MSFGKEQFRVLPEHVTLLSNAYTSWDDCEYGAASIDCKRPYGDSDVIGSIAELLKIAPDQPDEDEPYSDALVARLDRLHRQTSVVLQILLHTGVLQTGEYERERYGGRWSRIAD